MLTDIERSNIIVKILNKYYFGNYLDYEEDIYLCKLKNRGLSKKEEQNLEEMSFSILGEYVIELPQAENANPIVKDIRCLFINLRIYIDEAIKNKSKISYTLPFKIYSEKRDVKKFLKIINNIKMEFEYYFFKMTGKNIQINCISKKMRNNQNILFEIKEV